MLKEKTVAASRATLANVMLPDQANPAGNVHGGEIMKLMDTCAGVAAIRHSGGNCVTARVDELMFYHPIRVGQLVSCESSLVYVGRTSMEIRTKVFVEDYLHGVEPKLALTAFFTFVALDGSGKPREVPRLKTTTEEEKAAFEEGEKRYLSRKK